MGWPEVTFSEFNPIRFLADLTLTQPISKTDFDPTCTKTDSSEFHPNFTRPELQLTRNRTRLELGSLEINPNRTQTQTKFK